MCRCCRFWADWDHTAALRSVKNGGPDGPPQTGTAAAALAKAACNALWAGRGAQRRWRWRLCTCRRGEARQLLLLPDTAQRRSMRPIIAACCSCCWAWWDECAQQLYVLGLPLFCAVRDSNIWAVSCVWCAVASASLISDPICLSVGHVIHTVAQQRADTCCPSR